MIRVGVSILIFLFSYLVQAEVNSLDRLCAEAQVKFLNSLKLREYDALLGMVEPGTDLAYVLSSKYRDDLHKVWLSYLVDFAPVTSVHSVAVVNEFFSTCLGEIAMVKKNDTSSVPQRFPAATVKMVYRSGLQTVFVEDIQFNSEFEP